MCAQVMPSLLPVQRELKEATVELPPHKDEQGMVLTLQSPQLSPSRRGASRMRMCENITADEHVPSTPREVGDGP